MAQWLAGGALLDVYPKAGAVTAYVFPDPASRP